MKKPKQCIVRFYDYNECQKYIAHKMGVKSLRDFAGKYSENNPDAPYQDFWHVVMKHNQVCNGCYVWIPEPTSVPDWAKPICEKFIEEFGDIEFWVEW